MADAYLRLVGIHVRHLLEDRATQALVAAGALLGLGLPALVSLSGSGRRSPTVISALASSGSGSAVNRAYVAVYAALPLLAGLTPVYFGARLAGRARDHGVFALIRANRTAERRMVRARLVAGLLGTASVWAAFTAGLVLTLLIAGSGTARSLFSMKVVDPPTASAVVMAGIWMLFLHSASTYVISFVLGLVASANAATATPVSLYLAGMFLKGVPGIEALVRVLPSYYTDVWLAPISDDVIFDDFRHACSIAGLWIVMAVLVVLVVRPRPPKLGELG